MSISEVRKCSRLPTPVNSLIDQLRLGVAGVGYVLVRYNYPSTCYCV